MNSIGNVLKEARTRKSITLDEVHSKIKIHPRVLQLLEEDKFDRLPSPLFVKSFLKSYADFLEVNADDLLDAYQKLGEKPAEQVLFIRSADEKEESQKRGGQKLMTLAAIGLAAGLAIGAVIYFAPPTIKKMRSIRLPQMTAVPSAKKLAKTAGVVKEAAPAPAKTTPAKKGETSKRSAEWLRGAAQGNFPSIEPRTPLELKIKAIESVWLHITCDGTVVYKGFLKRGFAESWTAKETIEVWTGNASSIYLTLNRYSLGSPGKGVVKRMIISHQGVRISPQENH